MAINSCNDGPRCKGCPVEMLDERLYAGLLVDNAVEKGIDGLYAANRLELLRMAQQTTERWQEPTMLGVVAGGLLLVAENRCKRN